VFKIIDIKRARRNKLGIGCPRRDGEGSFQVIWPPSEGGSQGIKSINTQLNRESLSCDGWIFSTNVAKCRMISGMMMGSRRGCIVGSCGRVRRPAPLIFFFFFFFFCWNEIWTNQLQQTKYIIKLACLNLEICANNRAGGLDRAWLLFLFQFPVDRLLFFFFFFFLAGWLLA
jgi:hypothetical protein